MQVKRQEEVQEIQLILIIGKTSISFSQHTFHMKLFFRPKHRGPKRQDGHWVTEGTVLALQTKPRFFPGLNVILNHNFLYLICSPDLFLGWRWQKHDSHCKMSWTSLRYMREN